MASQDNLIRYYTFNESDLSLIRQRRGDASRLGFAVQLCLLRSQLRTAALSGQRTKLGDRRHCAVEHRLSGPVGAKLRFATFGAMSATGRFRTSHWAYPNVG